MKNKNKREYRSGRDDIDKIIADLAKACHSGDNVDLVEEMLTTIAKLGIENNDRGDLKLINMALKELRYASKIIIRAGKATPFVLESIENEKSKTTTTQRKEVIPNLRMRT